jgi:uncharacterized protein YgiM (DUF1202 family)
MRKRTWWIVPLVAAALSALAGPEDGTMYARKRLLLKDKPGLGGSAIATLQAGDAVKLVDRSDEKYWLVEADGKKGYAYAKSLTADEGVDMASALQKSGEQEARLVDLRPDGAIRGLTEEAEAFAKNAEVPASVVKDMEYISALGVSASDFETFLKNGKLGEYGGQ